MAHVTGTLHLSMATMAGRMANSEDPDEMPPYKAAFHQGLHCLLR